MTVRMDELSWPEYAARVRAGATLFLPCGALEQHGPHLPMATDAIFAEAIATRVATALGGLVMPRLAYGYKSQARSGGGQTFPGTTSLDGATLSAQVRDLLRELGRHGVERVVVVDGHYENQWFLTEGIDLGLRDVEARGQAMRVLRCEYWDYTPRDVLDRVFEGRFPGFDLEHAALIETSMMLALHPGLVRSDRIPKDDLGRFAPHDVYPQDGGGVPESGVLAPAGAASAEKGRWLIEAVVDAMVDALAGFCEESSQDARTRPAGR